MSSRSFELIKSAVLENNVPEYLAQKIIVPTVTPHKITAIKKTMPTKFGLLGLLPRLSSFVTEKPKID